MNIKDKAKSAIKSGISAALDFHYDRVDNEMVEDLKKQVLRQQRYINELEGRNAIYKLELQTLNKVVFRLGRQYRTWRTKFLKTVTPEMREQQKRNWLQSHAADAITVEKRPASVSG